MRSFQIVYIILFLIVYLLLAWFAFKNISAVSAKNKTRTLRWIFSLINGLAVLGFIFLYIYPNQPRQTTDTSIYFYFNALLFLLFIFNVPNSLFYFLHRLVKRRTPILPFVGIILSIGLSGGLVYGVLWGSHKIQINQVELEFSDLPESFDGYSVLQFSDLHIGSMLKSNKLLKKALKIVEDENPDLILFTGDIVNNFANEMDGFQSALKKLASNRNAYSILGNHDYGDYTAWSSEDEKQNNFEEIVSTLNETGFTVLRNEYTVIRENGDSIFLAGVENWGHPPFPQYANLEQAINPIPADAFTILMTHDPAHWDSKVKHRGDIELSLSGHTHGMQWGIKLAGIKFSVAYAANKYWGGLYTHNNSALYVNTGLGTVGIPWRLDMAPEITVFELKRREIN